MSNTWQINNLRVETKPQKRQDFSQNFTFFLFPISLSLLLCPSPSLSFLWHHQSTTFTWASEAQRSDLAEVEGAKKWMRQEACDGGGRAQEKWGFLFFSEDKNWTHFLDFGWSFQVSAFMGYVESTFYGLCWVFENLVRLYRFRRMGSEKLQ